MASLTKAQLVVELSTLREHCAKIEAQLESAQARLASLPAPRAQRPAYTPPAPSAEQLARREAMAKAKAAAIATGRSVLVA